MSKQSGNVPFGLARRELSDRSARPPTLRLSRDRLCAGLRRTSPGVVRRRLPIRPGLLPRLSPVLPRPHTLPVLDQRGDLMGHPSQTLDDIEPSNTGADSIQQFRSNQSKLQDIAERKIRDGAICPVMISSTDVLAN